MKTSRFGFKSEVFGGYLKKDAFACIMKKMLLLSCIFSFLILSIYAQSEDIAIKQGEIPQRLNSPNEVGKLIEWKRYNFDEANFSILFPAKPGRHENSGSLSNGFLNQFRYYWDTSDEQLYFEAQILEVSSEKSYNFQQGLQGFKQQMKKRNAVLLTEKNRQVNNVAAVDLHYRVPDEPEPVLNYTRILYCNNRIYTLMVAGTKLQKDLSKVADKYLDSFFPIVACEKETSPTTETNQSTITRRYIRGPKGGCYYLNSQRNKVYVDRSLCR